MNAMCRSAISSDRWYKNSTLLLFLVQVTKIFSGGGMFVSFCGCIDKKSRQYQHVIVLIKWTCFSHYSENGVPLAVYDINKFKDQHKIGRRIVTSCIYYVVAKIGPYTLKDVDM